MTRKRDKKTQDEIDSLHAASLAAAETIFSDPPPEPVTTVTITRIPRPITHVVLKRDRLHHMIQEITAVNPAAGDNAIVTSGDGATRTYTEFEPDKLVEWCEGVIEMLTGRDVRHRPFITHFGPSFGSEYGSEYPR